jgi:7-cyano-7-deazaguanine synthase
MTNKNNKHKKNKKAVILLSGGLDSTTTLFLAQKDGFECYCLIFDYGQRHSKEVLVAKNIAEICKVKYEIVKLDFPWKGSSLIDSNQSIPTNRNIDDTIPTTYVPGRNIIFLSIATSYAEVIGAEKIFIGANSVDYSGYPDCRPEFLESMQKSINLGTKQGTQNTGIKIETPLLSLSKKEIVLLGKKLGVPFEKTWSCYNGGVEPCGVCDSCVLRNKGFKEALEDEK